MLQIQRTMFLPHWAIRVVFILESVWQEYAEKARIVRNSKIVKVKGAIRTRRNIHT